MSLSRLSEYFGHWNPRGTSFMASPVPTPEHYPVSEQRLHRREGLRGDGWMIAEDRRGHGCAEGNLDLLHRCGHPHPGAVLGGVGMEPGMEVVADPDCLEAGVLYGVGELKEFLARSCLDTRS